MQPADDTRSVQGWVCSAGHCMVGFLLAFRSYCRQRRGRPQACALCFCFGVLFGSVACCMFASSTLLTRAHRLGCVPFARRGLVRLPLCRGECAVRQRRRAATAPAGHSGVLRAQGVVAALYFAGLCLCFQAPVLPQLTWHGSCQCTGQAKQLAVQQLGWRIFRDGIASSPSVPCQALRSPSYLTSRTVC